MATAEHTFERLAERLLDASEREDVGRFCDVAAAGLLTWSADDLLRAEVAFAPLVNASVLFGLLHADVRLRLGQTPLEELFALHAQVCDRMPNRHGLAAWATTMIAEWGLWRGDLSTLQYALEAYDPGSSSSTITQLAEARRRRVLACVALVTQPDSPQTEQAVADTLALFESISAAEEIAVSGSVFGYCQMAVGELPCWDELALQQDAVGQLMALRSSRLTNALALLAWSYYMVGDSSRCAETLDTYTALRVDSEHVLPMTRFGIAALHLLTQLGTEGPSSRVEQGMIETLNAVGPGSFPAWCVAPVANDLLDHGLVTVVEHLHAALMSTDQMERFARRAVIEVDARLRLVRDHDRSAVEALWDIARAQEAAGRPNRAALSALRDAWSCRHAGMVAEADALTAWGLQRLPADPPAWADRWVRSPANIDSKQDLRGRIVLDAPTPYVERAGTQIELDPLITPLFAQLAGATQPVPAAELASALWPTLDPAHAASLLTGVITHTRRILDLWPGELLCADERGYRLDRTGWVLELPIDLTSVVELSESHGVDVTDPPAPSAGSSGQTQLHTTDS